MRLILLTRWIEILNLKDQKMLKKYNGEMWKMVWFYKFLTHFTYYRTSNGMVLNGNFLNFYKIMGTYRLWIESKLNLYNGDYE